MKNAAKLAQNVHRDLIKEGIEWATWDELREFVDMSSGGDLDCIELDILTDMVFSRCKKDAISWDDVAPYKWILGPLSK